MTTMMQEHVYEVKLLVKPCFAQKNDFGDDWTVEVKEAILAHNCGEALDRALELCTNLQTERHGTVKSVELVSVEAIVTDDWLLEWYTTTHKLEKPPVH